MSSKMMVMLLGVLLLAPIGNADEVPQVEEKLFKDVAGELRCPTCTGLSVLDSDAAFSVQIKNEVKKQLDQGKEKQALKDRFNAIKKRVGAQPKAVSAIEHELDALGVRNLLDDGTIEYNSELGDIVPTRIERTAFANLRYSF